MKQFPEQAALELKKQRPEFTAAGVGTSCRELCKRALEPHGQGLPVTVAEGWAVWAQDHRLKAGSRAGAQWSPPLPG